MSKYVNQSGGTLVLPDGISIPNGAVADITGDGEKNVAVAQWVGEGKLVAAKAEPKAEPKAPAKSDK